jgi:hypothetical protein
MTPSRLLLLAVVALLTVGTQSAAAAERTETFRVGPVTVGGYQVLQEQALAGLPKPSSDSFITAMKVDVVDKDGTPVSIRRLMLHHIVFLNLGTQVGEKQDPTCSRITALDSRTQIPALAERFYAAGEERATLRRATATGPRARTSG